MKHTVRRLAVVLAAGAAVLIGVSGVASAHVTAHAPEATQGGYGVVTFRVPTESDTASTVGLQVKLPDNAPVASVRTRPVPGWTATTKTKHLGQPITTSGGDQVSDVVSEVSWTADPGQGIAPGQYQDFSASLGPLPKVSSLAFPAIQTYSDGSQVAWIEPTVKGQPEPQHPAPSITLAAATEQAAAPAGTTGSTAATGGPSGLAIAGVALGGAGLLLALAALAMVSRNNRRRPATPEPADRAPAGVFANR